jgi:DNA-directed RNA polymerase subunit F
MDSKPQIIEENVISMYELKDEISKIKKRDNELSFRAQKTEEYLNTIDVLSIKKGKELYAEIEKLNIPRLKADHIYKIIDIMPKDIESVKLILQAYTITVSQENIKKIVELIKKQ